MIASVNYRGIRKHLFATVLIFLALLSMHSHGHQDRRGTTQEAVELTKKLIMSDKGEKKYILREFEKLLAKHPDDLIVRDMYINNLIATGYYQEGLTKLEVINKKEPSRTNLLTQCMLQERLGYRDEKCYEKVIELSEKDNAVDSDYMSALFFTNDKRFGKIKAKLIKNNAFKESDFFIFTLEKEKVLYEFFP